jgi:hypothetical protein
MELIVALLLYPGLIFTVVLAVVFAVLMEWRVEWSRMRGGAGLASFDGLAGIGSLLLAALAPALMPWPLHPASDWRWIGNPLALWAAAEGAFLLPLLPALLSQNPFVTRAASREAQIGVAGRCVVWLAIGGALWLPATWEPALLPGRIVLLLAGVLAIPAAAGIGPFAAEQSLVAHGVEEGLDDSTASLLRFVRIVRSTALLAGLIVASLASAPIQPWAALLLIIALLSVVALLLRQVSAALPRSTLPGALRWCWWRALPLAVAGIVYLAVV